MKKIILFVLFALPFIVIAQTPTIQFTKHVVDESANGSFYSWAVDMDDDDDLDIVATAFLGDELSWHENDGNQNYTEHFIDNNAVQANTVYVYDFDLDGDFDIFGFDGTGYVYFENDGNQNFTKKTFLELLGQNYDVNNYYLFVDDFNGDGIQNFVQYFDDVITWYDSSGGQNFVAKTVAPIQNTIAYFKQDIDNDKDVDYIVRDTITNETFFLENISGQSIQKRSITFDYQNVDTAIMYYLKNDIMADFDQDGDLDLVAYSWNLNEVYWFENDGNENFTKYTIDNSIAYPWVISVADINNDNFIDIVISDYSNDEIVWYQNDSTQSFTKYKIDKPVDGPLGHFLSDLDSDGDTDIAVNAYVGGKLSWLENNYTATPRTYANLSDTENYVYTMVARKAAIDEAQLNEDDDVIESVTYFDGLGRPKQQIGIKQSPTRKDIISHIEYDAFGRQAKDFLPYVPTAAGNEGSFKITNQNTAVNTYYQTYYPNDLDGTPNPYSEKVFEASPLNRVLEQAAPGKDWKVSNNHTIKFDYQTNIANEVKLYEVNFIDPLNTEAPSLVENGSYIENELYKTVTKDENWLASQTNINDHTTEEFKDKQGRVLLKRTYTTNVAHDTYYVYDDFGNLTYVIPPKASVETAITQEILEELCYQYRYGYRNKLVEKKIPGKGWEYIVYDKLDRPVLTQDINLRNDGDAYKWLFTKYDAFDRVIYTGTIRFEETREQVQTAYNDLTYTLHETKTASPSTYGNSQFYYTYTNLSFPFEHSSGSELHTVNYYDDYDNFDLVGAAGENPGSVFGQSVTANTKGLPTCTKVKVLGTTNKWITTVTYYDHKARPIYVFSKNKYLNTRDIIKSQLDFTGNVTKTITRHFKGQNPVIKTTDFFSYDHTNRLIDHKQKIGTQDKELIAQNTYDELGQLRSKAVGNKPNGTRLQNIDYKYNIRGWLKSINDPENSLASDDLFAFGINYNTITLNNQGTTRLNTEPLYNGNISETIWRTANDDKKRAYGYKYDALNRLDKARYKAGTNLNEEVQFFDVKNINYDVNGNITKLVRKSPNAAFNDNEETDNLVYVYEANGLSNKLKKVTDNTSLDRGFKDGNTSGNDYLYDANGNLTKDKNKGITNIKYNHINLPTLIRFGTTGKIQYFYDASGIKLKKKVTEGSAVTTTDYAGNYVYENGQLQFFNHPEGYVTESGSTYSYVYQYRDDLGSVRFSYSDSDGNGTITQSEIIEEKNYYPFGMLHSGYNSNVNGVHHKWDYLNQERQEEFGLNWLTFRHRNYMPEIGRFFGVDPVSEEYFSISTYQFAHNNPIWKVEIEGLEGQEKTGKDVINFEKVKFFQPRIQSVGKIFKAKGTLRGKIGSSGGFSVSLGKNLKLTESINVLEVSGTVTTDPSVKGKMNVLNISGELSAPGIGKTKLTASIGEVTGTLSENKKEGDISLGTFGLESTIEGGPSTTVKGALVSSNEDKNGKITKAKIGVGDVSGVMDGNTIGVGAKAGPASVAVSANKTELKKAVSNFFNRLYDLVINGIQKPDKN